MKTCDICGRQANKLMTVEKDYQSSDVKEVCVSCGSLINDSITKLNNVNYQILKKMKFSLVTGLILSLRKKYGRISGYRPEVDNVDTSPSKESSIC